MNSVDHRVKGSFTDAFFFGSVIALLGVVSFCPPFILERRPFLVLGCLLFVFAALVANKGFAILRKSDLPLWIFLAAFGMNVLFARDKSAAWNTYINLSVTMLCVYYVTAEAVTSARKFDILVKMICLFTVLSALLGIIDTVAGWNPLYEFYLQNPYYDRYKDSGFLRAMSTHCNPAILGTYLIAGCPFLILVARSQKDMPNKIAGAVMLAMVIAAVLLTCSRGVFIALTGSLLLLFAFLNRNKTGYIVLILAAVLIFIVVCSFLPYPFAKYGIQGFVFSGDGIISQYRLSRVAMAYDMFASAPFSGVGFQHFRLLFNGYNPLPYPETYEFMIADNMYLTILAETGAVGFLGFCVFVFFVFKKAAALKRARINSYLLMAGIAALLINMGAFELFYWFNPYIYFCLLTGLVEALWRTPPQTRT
ncbi:MAG: O-antigen ligase family protein [Candidatus Omnitrophota bacterium]